MYYFKLFLIKFILYYNNIMVKNKKNLVNIIIQSNNIANDNKNYSNIINNILKGPYDVLKRIAIHNIISNILNKRNITSTEKRNIITIIEYLIKNNTLYAKSTLIFIIDKIYLFGKDNKEDILNKFNGYSDYINYISLYESQENSLSESTLSESTIISKGLNKIRRILYRINPIETIAKRSTLIRNIRNIYKDNPVKGISEESKTTTNKNLVITEEIINNIHNFLKKTNNSYIQIFINKLKNNNNYKNINSINDIINYLRSNEGQNKKLKLIEYIENFSKKEKLRSNNSPLTRQQSKTNPFNNNLSQVEILSEPENNRPPSYSPSKVPPEVPPQAVSQGGPQGEPPQAAENRKRLLSSIKTHTHILTKPNPKPKPKPEKLTTLDLLQKTMNMRRSNLRYNNSGSESGSKSEWE